jgi:hypothetical protein
MSMRRLLLTLLALQILLPAIAVAGGSDPWCLVRDESEKCAFLEANTCYASVAKTGGYCRPNQRHVGVSGNRKWCVITVDRKNCNFYSQRRCLSAARNVNGGCVENTEQALALAQRSGEAFGVLEGGNIADELQRSQRDSVTERRRQQQGSRQRQGDVPLEGAEF